jgi:hypothetical protein
MTNNVNVHEARRRFDARVSLCGDAAGLLKWLRQHGIRASRGASCGGDSLMASLSNYLSPGTFARVERDADLAIISPDGSESYAPLQEPARGVELAHERGELPPEFYGPPVRPAIDGWPHSATDETERPPAA